MTDVLTLPPAKGVEEFSLASGEQFAMLEKWANIFSRSALVPAHYRGQKEDCMIALQMAHRHQVEPMMFLQNTYVVHGKPAMEGKLAIALINHRGPFTGPIEYRFEGEGASRQCTAIGTLPNGKTVEGPTVSIKMATDTGWAKNDAWKNMPDLMLTYRAAVFLGRTHCPEVLMGLYTKEEMQDIIEINPKQTVALNPIPDPPPAIKIETEVEAPLFPLPDEMEIAKRINDGFAKACEEEMPPGDYWKKEGNELSKRASGAAEKVKCAAVKEYWKTQWDAEQARKTDEEASQPVVKW